MFSTGALFAAFLEPLFFKRAIVWYEILFGIIVVLGVYLIVNSEIKYLTGILLGISSALFSSLFAVINGRFIKKHNATTISFYEFIGGILCISIYLLVAETGFDSNFFTLNTSDLIYLIILASVCTAYAFIAAVYIMKFISPYSVVLSYQLRTGLRHTIGYLVFWR